MAVITQYAAEVFGATVGGIRGAPDYTSSHGTYRVTSGKVTCAASDSSGSTYWLARLPSTVILRPESKIDLQAWGFTIAKIGIVTDTDALLSVADTTGLSDVSTFLAFDDAKWNKPLWEQLGLASDPGSTFDIGLFTEAAASGSGDAPFEFHWQGV